MGEKTTFRGFLLLLSKRSNSALDCWDISAWSSFSGILLSKAVDCRSRPKSWESEKSAESYVALTICLLPVSRDLLGWLLPRKSSSVGYVRTINLVTHFSLSQIIFFPVLDFGLRFPALSSQKPMVLQKRRPLLVKGIINLNYEQT